MKPGATVPPDPGVSYDRAALAELQREEVEISVADLECEKREVDPVERIVLPAAIRTASSQATPCSRATACAAARDEASPALSAVIAAETPA